MLKNDQLIHLLINPMSFYNNFVCAHYHLHHLHFNGNFPVGHWLASYPQFSFSTCSAVEKKPGMAHSARGLEV